MQFKCLEKVACYGVFAHLICNSFIFVVHSRQITFFIYSTKSFAFHLAAYTEFDPLFCFLHKLSPAGTVRCCLLELKWVVSAMQPCHPAPVSSYVPVWFTHPATSLLQSPF